MNDMSRMPDGNTAAERIHNSASRDREEPTDDQLEDFISNLLDEKRDELGIEFLREAMSEASDADLVDLFKAFKAGNSAEIGIALKDWVAKYWRPTALRAAEDYDFTPEPCRCRGDCTC